MATTKRSRASSKYGTLRGLVGSVRERAYGVDQQVRTFRAVRGLRDVHGKARGSLPPDSYSAYFEYINNFASEMLRQIPLKGYSNVAALVEMPSLSLHDEISWNVARIKAGAEEINKIVSACGELGELAWNGDKRAFLKASEVSEEFGESIFLIERRIFLHQFFDGLQAQKKYVASVKSSLTGGVAPFLCHYISVRNEPSTSVERFSSDVKARCEKIKDRELAVYLEYRLTRQWQNDEAAIANVLRVEQNNATIDVYETFLCLVNAVRSGRVSVEIDIDGIMDELKDIEDSRLQTGVDDSCARECKGARNLASGNYRSAMRECLQDGCRTVEQVFIASVSRAHASHTGIYRAREHKSLRNLLVSRFADSLRGAERAKSAQSELKKVFLNWYDGALVSVGSRLGSIDIFDSVSMRAAALSVPTKVQETNFLSELARHGDIVRLINDFSISLRGGGEGKLGEDASCIVHASRLANECNVDEAIVALYPLVKSRRKFVSNFANKMAVEVAAANQNVPAFVKALADGAVQHGSISLSPGALAYAADLRWKDVRAYSADIRLPITAHYLHKRNVGKSWGSCLRFSIDDFLRLHGIDKPSQIDLNSNGSDLVKYFWGTVCEQNVVDMIRTIDGVRCLRLEMREILSALRAIDPQCSEYYDSEIVSITHSLMVEDGKKIVDQSRIYVDEDALRDLLRLELAEPFSRYRALAPATADDTREFDEVLRRVAKGDLGSGDLTYPKSEADQLLVEMITLSCNRFLFDAKHGLDSYLSKRIRHGSIVGHLRGAIEQHEIIFQALSAGLPYDQPDGWQDQYADVSTDDQREIVKAMCEFSERIDAELLYTKNNVVQIRTADKTSGLLGINLGGAEYHTIRSFVRRDLTFEGFLTSMFAAFWGLLNPSLDAVKLHLRERTAQTISEEFSRVRSTVVSKRLKHPELTTLLSRLDQACRDVLAEVESVAQWFEKSGLEHANRRYKLQDAFTIGIESSKAAYKNSKVRIVELVVPDFDITMADVPVLADVLLVVLGNVHTKSGVSEGARVSISTAIIESKGVLSISIKSQIASDIKHVNEARVASIREEIREGRIEQSLRREGESGLKKLAAIVGQSENGNLEFGFASGSEFFVNVELSLILQGGAK